MQTEARVELRASGAHLAYYQRESSMLRANLTSLLELFARFGRDPAVVQRRGYRREKRTYAELHLDAVLWSSLLGMKGIAPGDRVLLWGANSAEWIGCFWAIQLRGAIAVPMDPSASAEFVQRVVRDAGVKLILRDRELSALGTEISSLTLDDLRASSASELVTAEFSRNQGSSSHQNTVAEILYTSGTTGEPRGVVLSHENFLANLEPIEREIQKYRKYERWMHPLRFVSLVPLSHVFGQFMTLFLPPVLGATVVLEHSTNPREIVRTIKNERATALIAVPQMLDTLRGAIEREIDSRGWRDWFEKARKRADAKSFLKRAWMFRRIHRMFGWRFWAFICGGAALSSETELFLKRLGYAVVQGYGMTETASLISLNHPFRAAEGSVGKILPGREFKLAEDGEILVRGANVSSGYWEAGEVRAARDSEWLHTGDIGELDAEGNLRFRGRKKNVIVTPAGLNVFPEDIEAKLRAAPEVSDCVVLPIRSGSDTQACAVLLLKGSEANAAEAIERANRKLAEYQRVRQWVVWPEMDFPRTPTGKPKLAAIEERLPQLMSAGKASAAASSMFAGLPIPLPTDGSLQSLSSLERVELLSAVEEKYKVELSETEFSEAKTVADVERLLREPSAKRSEYVYPRWSQYELVRWFRLAVYYALVWPATQILGHPRVIGRENLRALRGPAIVISNHITRRADIGLILAALPARFRRRLATAMGGETLLQMRKPPREWFFAKRWACQIGYCLVTGLFNVFPLPQLSGFRESFRFAGESVDRGYSVLIFPEGEVNNSEDGAMAPFQSGVGLLAQNLGLPIVPMRLDGVWGMKRERRRLAHIGEITVHIGKPIAFPVGTSAEEIAGRLQEIVAGL